MPTKRAPQALRRGFPLAFAAAAGITMLITSTAQAQIKRPGAHLKYDVEVEPHLVYQWMHELGHDEGIGLGVRASIPIINDGPIEQINNSMAISFGLDWAHFDDPCGSYWWRGGSPNPNDDAYYYYHQDCEASQFWLPAVGQWNFWITDKFSAFGEAGLAFQHLRWNYYYPCNSPDGWCEEDDSDTDLELVLWVGGRYLVSDSIALTLRLGDPNLTAGVSFFL